jgi:hypothetical protein
MSENLRNKSLKDLRRELLECSDKPIKKSLIKKLIKEKEKEKEKVNEKEDELIFSECSEDNNDETLSKLIELNKEKEIVETDNNQYFKSPYDNKFKKEIEKDYTNNKLLDRMNSELDFRINGKQQKIFDKPYIDETNNLSSYVSVSEFTKTTSLTNKENKDNSKILGQRKVIRG